MVPGFAKCGVALCKVKINNCKKDLRNWFVKHLCYDRLKLLKVEESKKLLAKRPRRKAVLYIAASVVLLPFLHN